jgi:hypothetical protein
MRTSNLEVTAINMNYHFYAMTASFSIGFIIFSFFLRFQVLTAFIALMMEAIAAPMKRRSTSTRLHSSTSQTTAIFMPLFVGYFYVMS